MNPISLLLFCLILVGLAPLRAGSLSAQNMSLQHGMDTSLPGPKKEFVSSIGQEDLRKKIGVSMTFEQIVPLRLSNGHIAYLKIPTDPPAGFNPDLPFLIGAAGNTSTVRCILTLRSLGRKNFPLSVPPWSEQWGYLRSITR